MILIDTTHMILIDTEICPYCRRSRPARDIVRLAAGITICASCRERHFEALHKLSTGEAIGECSECGTKVDELRERGETNMALHFENGFYRLMCMPCDKTYVPKRRELYANTEFGRENRL